VRPVALGNAEAVSLSALLEALFLHGEDADAQLARSVSRTLWDEALLAPVRDFLARPSKGFRAGLVELGFRLSSGTDSVLPLPIELPLIVECLHAGSLIIDDIEDHSEERRGAPALHRSYGLPRALNAGNWLYFWPQVLLRRTGLSPTARLAVHEHLALCLMRCHEGQALDLHVRVDKLPQREVATVARTVTRLKTGGLLGTAAALGAIAAEASEERVAAIATLGRELGVGLQMLDDLSGVLNVSRRHKALEDLRLGRVTWIWALLAEELDRPAYDAFLRELSEVMAGSSSDALIERLRFRIASLGVRRAQEHVSAAVDALASVIGRGAWCADVLDQFAWLEKRYVQA
jgi:geranylgeranyl pyrophosphate synthase